MKLNYAKGQKVVKKQKVEVTSKLRGQKLDKFMLNSCPPNPQSLLNMR